MKLVSSNISSKEYRVYGKIRNNKSHGAVTAPPPTKAENKDISAHRSDGKKCYICGESTHFAKSCPRKRIRCFKCHQEGHKAAECRSTERVMKPERNSVNTMLDEVVELGRSKSNCGLIFKEIKINNCVISALVDTGSDLCLIRRDTLTTLQLDEDLIPERRRLVGIGNSELTTMGHFTISVPIDGITLLIKFHVVRETDISYAMVIGNDILQQVDLIVRADGAIFREKTLLLDGQFGSYLKNIQRPAKGKPDVPTGNPGLAVYAPSAMSAAPMEKVGEGEIENETDCRAKELASPESVATSKEDGDCDGQMVKQFLEEFDGLYLAANTGELLNTDIDLSHLSKTIASEIDTIVRQYKPRGTKESPVKMRILLKDDYPVYDRPRRMSYEDRAIIEAQVSQWLAEGIIQRSTSEYAAATVLVPKKDGGKRLCCDYRRLDQKIVRGNFPIPLMDDVIERLQGSNVFTTLDLTNGFFHVPVEAESRKFTSFVTHNGQYEFLYVPFGISNSPAVFSRFISVVFRHLVQAGTVITYMDDLIIPAKDEEEGIEKLSKVLEVAAEYSLRIKWCKSQFLRKKVNFLGYIVENGSIRPSEAKTKAIKNFPIPHDRKSLQRFLGLTSYFRRFVEQYAAMAKPLSDLLRKDIKFELRDEQLIAFDQLKIALVNSPVLQLYDPKAVTEVHADACKSGYGAILLQKNTDDQQLHPVQYMSRKVKPAEEKYHSYELEVLAVVEAVKKWRVYLMGIKFKIVTDCNAFTMTMKKRDVPLRVSRWAMMLQDFDYTIEHRSGTKMRHVDALSRVSCLMLEDSLHYRLKQAQLQDGWIKAVRTILETREYEDFYIQHDVLYKDPTKELIVVPSLMEEEVIRLAHRLGHFSVKKTQDAVEKTFYIPQLQKKLIKIVKSCVECITFERKAGKPEGYLSPIYKEDQPLDTYHVDHVGPMESTKKAYNYLLVVVDGFSKFVWLYPTKNTGTEAVVERLSKQAATFGNPRRIITDRGVAFTSNLFKDYCENQHIRHLLITTGVPRGNGQVERIHRIVIPMLSKLCSENPGTWYKHVDRVQQLLNNSPPRSTKLSPFRILTGLNMRIPGVEELNELLSDDII